MNRLLVLALSLSLLFPCTAVGQDDQQPKVVVIPLGAADKAAAGIDFDTSPNNTTIASITTCADRTLLKGVAITVPKSKTDSYVVCRASGRTFHSQTGKWVLYSIDDDVGTGNDVFTYTGVATTTSTYNNYDSYAMQNVYTFPPAGGSDIYYLKACRQDTDTTGTAYHDDFTCEVFLERY